MTLKGKAMTKRFNAENERIKHQYFEFKREADQKDPATIEGIRRALYAYDVFTGFKPYKAFCRQIAIDFKAHLGKPDKQTNKVLSLATRRSTLKHLQSFLLWLRTRPGFKKAIHADDIAYLNLSAKEMRGTRTIKVKPIATVEQIRRVIAAMPHATDIEKRDRDLITMALLTGARVQALATLKLKHFDRVNQLVNQDPKDVNAKFGKQIVCYLVPVSDGLIDIVDEWAAYLETEKLFGLNDPLFPMTMVGQDKNNCFVATGLSRDHWTSTQPIRDIFRCAFEAVGMAYHNPHSFRDTLVHYGQSCCKSPEEYKALSQNLGHKSPLVTFASYGNIPHHRQGELIKGLGKRESVGFDKDIAQKIMAFLTQS